jgi:hypothetical protein
MIHVPRPLEVPTALTGAAAETARASAEAYFTASKSLRRQTRYEFDQDVLKAIEANIWRLFKGNCAMCESPVEPSPHGAETRRANVNAGAVRRFRPGNEVRSQAPGERFDGYWWLAYEWDNLLLICDQCQRARLNLFPIEGPRASPGDRGEHLLTERPLLLDPCRDDPETYLSFDDKGRVRRRERNRRAEATITAFALNRPDLLAARGHVAKDVRAALTLLIMPAPRRPFTASPSDPAYALEVIKPMDASYVALRRAIVGRWLERHGAALDRLLRGVLEAFARTATGGIARTPERKPKKTTPRRTGAAKRATPTRTSPRLAATATTAAPDQAWYLRRVEVRNFRALAALSVDIPPGTTNRTGWQMLLGENGAGKSSLLEAVALALMDSRRLTDLGVKGRTLLRRLSTGKSVASGHVRLFWRDRETTWTMRFTKSRIAFEGEAPPRSLVVRAYGATRRLPSGKVRVKAGTAAQRIENLLDPFVPVCDATEWLLALKGAAAFDSAALSLKDLFGLSRRARLRSARGRVVIRLDGVDIALDELSDGFQSVLVLAVDIMSAVHGQAHDLQHAVGIVLLDEIDAHLHPRWKMLIVDRLRRTFPGLQFIATTHEPLCVRGLGAGEVAVLQREEGRIRAVVGLPSPTGLRVDELLTSPYFGLYSTIDPENERDFRRYYALLGTSKPDRTEAEEQELGTLRERLGSIGGLGTTRREQLINEVIDRDIAKEPRLTETADALKPETRARVLRLWRALPSEPETA